MTNFRIEYSHPWLLLLLIPAVVLTLLPYFRAAKKYRRTRNKILSIVFHLTALVLAINLLAGIKFTYEIPNKENQVILLVDASDSGEENKQAKDDFIASVINVCDNEYSVGIVKFGFDQKYVAEISEDAYGAYEKYLTSEDPDTSATDLASALKYASTLFTNPKTSKIVVISDGIETDNAAVSVIKAIAAEGIKVDTVNFPNAEHGEVQIVDVKLPDENIELDVPFAAEITIKHNLGEGEHDIRITASHNGESLGSTDAKIVKETETLLVSLSVAERDVHEFTFTIESTDDTLTSNNTYHSFINLQKFENILIIERKEGEGSALAEILQTEYKPVTYSLQQDMDAMPLTIEQMAQYEQIILVNVAYSDMPIGFEENLNRYVYELGGGLLTVGGENDIIGGKQVPHAYNRNDIANSTYFKQMLPVNAIDYTPPVAVVIVLDMSASMSSGRADAAREGAEACLSVLSDRDFCGVVSFQTRSSEEIELLPVSRRDELVNVIREVGQGTTEGGTIFSSAIQRAGLTLAPVDYVERKHIILVTDGNPGDTPDQYLPYVEENLKSGITMSIVVVEDADSSIESNMTEAANKGGGKFYEIPMNKLSTIPDVMQQDLVMNAVAEIEYGRDFPLTLKDLSPITSGITDESLIPPLAGYYGTVAKNGAVVPLMAEYVPMYAERQYGAGTVGSFMCDLSKIWSKTFMEDTAVGQRIILNIAASVFPKEDVVVDSIKYNLKTDNYTSQLSLYGMLDTDKIEVFVLPVSDSLVSILEEGVPVVTVENNKRYKFIIKDPGLYQVNVRKIGESGEPLDELSFYQAFSYSEEYNAFPEREPIGEKLLELLAHDGRGLVVEDPATVFESFSKTLAKEYDPRIVLLIISIICVLLDIAVRKFKFKWPHELIRERKQKKADSASRSK